MAINRGIVMEKVLCYEDTLKSGGTAPDPTPSESNTTSQNLPKVAPLPESLITELEAKGSHVPEKNKFDTEIFCPRGCQEFSTRVSTHIASCYCPRQDVKL